MLALAPWPLTRAVWERLWWLGPGGEAVAPAAMLRAVWCAVAPPGALPAEDDLAAAVVLRFLVGLN